MIYDLIVVGNGLAAQTFLFELFNQKSTVIKNQNFSVGQVYSDEISPPCSVRTTATVALSGIEEGISPLGNELRESYFLFEKFFETHKPLGVEKVNQFILHSNAEEKEKLTRRYKTLSPIVADFLREEMTGVEMESYQISPQTFKSWLEEKIGSFEIDRNKNFVRSMELNDLGHVELTLLNGQILTAKKILLATGAYSKIFSSFFKTSEMDATGVLAGSYLERSVDLQRPSFFITLDGNKCVYRSNEKQLVIGSVSQKGAFESADFEELKSIVKLFKDHLKIDIGEMDDYKMITGLRHKGRQRRPIYKALDSEKKIIMISGFYKNGFTFSHLAAREILKDLNL